jgi:hypothetical protein
MVQPLEINLSENVNSLFQDPQEAIFGRFQEIQGVTLTQPSMNLTSTAVMTENLLVGDLETQRQLEGNQSWAENPSYLMNDFDIDAMLQPWTALSEGSRASVGSSSRLSLGSTASLSCSCTAEHNCQAATSNQSNIPRQPDQPETFPAAPSLASNDAVMTLLQSMTRSILALEKRLEREKRPESFPPPS